MAVARLPGHPVHDGAHAHDFLVLFYAHRADGTVSVDGRPWPVSDGDLFVLAPGQVVAVDGPLVDGWVMWFPADVVRSGAYASWRSHPLLFPFARGGDRAPAAAGPTVVRRRTGRTVQQWSTQRRLQEARHLLTETDLGVAAVARRCGYPDPSYFIKRFRAEYALTPARWRTG